MAQVINLERYVVRAPPESRSFGSVRRRGQRLYVKFTYLGRKLEKPTGLKDTKANRSKARAFLKRVGEAVEEQTFCFAEAFPGAPEDEKKYFSSLEGCEYHRQPGDLAFGEYLESWTERNLEREFSETKRRDYRSIIDCHIRDRFGAMTFDQLTGVEVVQFVRELRELPGRGGRRLSSSRIRNILIPLRIVWEDACEEHQWELRDPFVHLKRRNRNGQLIPNRRKNPPEVFRISEWEAILEATDDWYRPIVELMVMTGMINSEMARLRRQDDQGDRLVVHGTKTEYRHRTLPVTNAMRGCLDALRARSTDEHLVALHTGKPLDANRFRQEFWTKTLRNAGVSYRRPYVMRHTFALWSLVVGVHPSRVVALMGHGSKQMVYDVYGKYTEGIEEDAAAIGRYLGGDFG